MSNSKVMVCAVLYTSLMGSTALAQSANDEVTVLDRLFIESDNRIATPVDEATRSVTVISNEEIEQQKATTKSVADILANTIPGFSPSTEANTDFGMTLRGRNFLTLIDGVPQSTPLRDGRRSLNSIDPSSIERIEVVRGGNAAYGFGATGGTINIITKRPKDGENKAYAAAGVSFSATSSNSDSISYDAQYGMSGREGAVDYVLDASFINRGSFFDADGDRIPSDPTGIQGGIAESDTYNLLGKVGYNFDGDNQRIQFGALYYNLEQDPDFGLSGRGIPDLDIPSPAVRGNLNPVNQGTKNLNLTAEYTNEDFLGSSLNAQLYYTDLEITFGKFPLPIRPPLPFTFPQTQILSEKLGGRLTINTPLDDFVEGSSVTWGIDALRDKTIQRSTDLATSLPPAVVGFLNGRQPDPVLEQDAIAGFAQFEIPLDDRFKISTGVRHEVIDVDVSNFVFINPRTFVPTNANGGRLEFEETLFNFTASYEAFDGVEIFGGFSQGFTLADIGRSLTDISFGVVNNVQSEAQKTDNFELGVRLTGDNWDANVVGFASKSDNGTSFSPTLVIRKQPELIRGIEASVNYAFDNQTRIGGTVTYLDGKVDTNNDSLLDQDLPTTRIPPMKVTGYVEFQPTDWWSARVQALYSGNRTPNSTAFGGTRDIKDYLVVDAYSSFDVGPGVLEVGVKNIFNEEYTPVVNQAFDTTPANVANAPSFAYARGPGRTVSLRYKVEF